MCAAAPFSAVVFDLPSQQPVTTTIGVKVGPSTHGCSRMARLEDQETPIARSVRSQPKRLAGVVGASRPSQYHA